MTPREQALEAALKAVLPIAEEILPYMIPEDASDMMWMKKAHSTLENTRAALAMPSEPEPEWLPTPLADPPGTAQWEAGDFVRTRDGCEAGPITIEKLMIWSFLVGNAFRPDGRALIDGGRDPFDITHVRKAVK